MLSLAQECSAGWGLLCDAVPKSASLELASLSLLCYHNKRRLEPALVCGRQPKRFQTYATMFSQSLHYDLH